MAIVGSAIDVSYRLGGESTQNDQDREYRRFFMVESDLTDEFESVVATAPGVPFHGDAHPSDLGAFAKEFTLTREPDNRKVWYVEVLYDSTVDEQKEKKDPDPLNRAAQVSWESTQTQKFIWQDINGDPIKTKAGEYFVDTPTIDEVRWVLTIEKNVSAPVDLTWLLTYPNKLNSAAVTVDGVSFNAKTLKCQGVTISKNVIENNISHRKLKVVLHYNPDGWALEILHRGYVHVNPLYPAEGEPEIVPIKLPLVDKDGLLLSHNDATREKVTSPYLLDDAGTAIANPHTFPADYETFEVYSTVDFTALPGVT